MSQFAAAGTHVRVSAQSSTPTPNKCLKAAEPSTPVHLRIWRWISGQQVNQTPGKKLPVLQELRYGNKAAHAALSAPTANANASGLALKPVKPPKPGLALGKPEVGGAYFDAFASPSVGAGEEAEREGEGEGEGELGIEAADALAWDGVLSSMPRTCVRRSGSGSGRRSSRGGSDGGSRRSSRGRSSRGSSSPRSPRDSHAHAADESADKDAGSRGSSGRKRSRCFSAVDSDRVQVEASVLRRRGMEGGAA
jgi:hypothetical protein